MNYKLMGVFLIVVGVVILGAVTYRNTHKSKQPIIYSPTFMLNALWESYKKTYIEPMSGRTVDPQRENITTSEGQSYTMMRAVWQDDKTVFDQSLKWIQDNLQRPDDALFSWLYGKRSDGTYGILVDKGGNNSASDADTDIALALIEASARWEQPGYLDQAKLMIDSIWKNEVVTVNGVPYMAADNLEQFAATQIVINPSYLSPYAYRIFAQLDPSHDWNGVINSSFDVLNKSLELNLDKSTSAYIPPNWIVINIADGTIAAPAASANLDTDYGYDALRVPFRLALDYAWNKDQRDADTLNRMEFFNSEWKSSSALHALYGHDGSTISVYETPAMYGGTIGYFIAAHPDAARDLYTKKLITLYSPDNQDWATTIGYYDSNWAWFGLALYNSHLVNFYPLKK